MSRLAPQLQNTFFWKSHWAGYHNIVSNKDKQDLWSIWLFNDYPLVLSPTPRDCLSRWEKTMRERRRDQWRKRVLVSTSSSQFCKSLRLESTLKSKKRVQWEFHLGDCAAEHRGGLLLQAPVGTQATVGEILKETRANFGASWGLGASQESKCGSAVNGGGVDSGQWAGARCSRQTKGGAHTEAGLKIKSNHILLKVKVLRANSHVKGWKKGMFHTVESAEGR